MVCVCFGWLVDNKSYSSCVAAAVSSSSILGAKKNFIEPKSPMGYVTPLEKGNRKERKKNLKSL